MSDSPVLSSDTKCILKLSLGNKGTRRIPFQKLWNASENSVSFSQLLTLTHEYLGISSSSSSSPSTVISYTDEEENEISEELETCIAISYLDEDGDEILMSSNEELEDAILQFYHKQPPVLRAFVKESNNVRKREMRMKKMKVMGKLNKRVKELEKGLKDLEEKVAGQGMVVAGLKLRGMEEEEKETTTEKKKDSVIQVQAENKSASTQVDMNVSGAALTQVYLSSSKLSSDSSEDDKESVKPPVEVEPKEGKEEAPEAPAPVSTPAPVEKKPVPTVKGIELSCFKSDFIHGRHTCDGCFKTPIMGYRFHATNLPDYDLCQKCFENYKGSQILFQPEELDRDRYLQHRWNMKKNKKERQNNRQNPRGHGRNNCQFKITKNRHNNHAVRDAYQRSVGETAVNEVAYKFCDAALNKAIKRSLEEDMAMQAKKKEEKKVVEEEDDYIPTQVLVAVPAEKETARSVVSAEAKDSEPEFHIPVAPTHTPQEVLLHPVEACLGLEQPEEEAQDVISVPSQGEKILDGEEEDYKEDIKSQGSVGSNDWQVLDESGQVMDHRVAQAAQALGSALFQSQSDMESDHGVQVEEVRSGESVASGLTSVPSLKSAKKPELSQVLLARWDEELRQLHELGFFDDHENVEVLDYLEAANMGVDADEPVSVNAAVEYLLSKKGGSASA